jgi:hypothetical protein
LDVPLGIGRATKDESEVIDFGRIQQSMESSWADLVQHSGDDIRCCESDIESLRKQRDVGQGADVEDMRCIFGAIGRKVDGDLKVKDLDTVMLGVTHCCVDVIRRFGGFDGDGLEVEIEVEEVCNLKVSKFVGH